MDRGMHLCGSKTLLNETHTKRDSENDTFLLVNLVANLVVTSHFMIIIHIDVNTFQSGPISKLSPSNPNLQ